MLLLLACNEYTLEKDESPAPFDSGEGPEWHESTVLESEADSPIDTAVLESTPPPPEEECDGLDNDGDGEVDEGFDEDLDGVADCLEVDHEVQFVLTVDDAWEAWADGAELGSMADWSTAGHFDLTLETGPHVLAVHAWDIYGMPSGFMAAVFVDGVPWALTGDGSWVYVRSEPAVGWQDEGFDDSAWTTPDVCTGTWWGTSPAELWDAGAAMIWEGDCTTVGDAWLRLDLDLP